MPGAVEANVTVTAVPAMMNSSGAVASTRPPDGGGVAAAEAAGRDDAVGQRRRRSALERGPQHVVAEPHLLGLPLLGAFRQKPGHPSRALELEDQGLELRDETVAAARYVAAGSAIDSIANGAEADRVVRAERVERVHGGVRRCAAPRE